MSYRQSKAKTARIRTAWEYALSVLSRSGKSMQEMQQKLKQKGYAEQDIAATLEKLIKLNYLNDIEMTRQTVARLSKKSNRVIRQKLIQKGLATDYREDIIAELESEESRARILCEKKMKNLTTVDSRQCFQKLIGILMRAGFPFSLSRQVVKSVLKTEVDDYD